MSKGRPRKSAVQKKAEGTLRADRTPFQEVTFSRMEEIPTAPSDLTLAAQAMFIELCKELVPRKLLSPVDLPMLKAYCKAYSLYEEYQTRAEGREIFETPNGYPMPNPYISMANQQLKVAIQLGNMLGVTPGARARIPAPDQPRQFDIFDMIDS